MSAMRLMRLASAVMMVFAHCPGSMAISIGYIGARTDDAGLGGSNNTAININN